MSRRIKWKAIRNDLIESIAVVSLLISFPIIVIGIMIYMLWESWTEEVKEP